MQLHDIDITDIIKLYEIANLSNEIKYKIVSKSSQNNSNHVIESITNQHDLV